MLLMLLASQAMGQRLFNGVKKISNARGTFWLGWGYNRSYYTQSDIQFRDKTYDFTLRNSTARDFRPSTGDHFAAETMFKTQFDFKVGYYFRNKYADSFGYNRFNYVFDDGNQVLLDGKIDTTLNTPWRGTSKNEDIITNRNDFHYQNAMNFLHGNIQRTDKLYQSRNKMVAFSTSYGLSLGAILSNNTFLFAGKLNENRRTFTGYGLAAFLSARLEFFRHIYLQGQLTGGSINQTKVHTATINDPDTWAKQQFWYGQRSITLGFFYYFKPGNSCNDCPVW